MAKTSKIDVKLNFDHSKLEDIKVQLEKYKKELPVSIGDPVYDPNNGTVTVPSTNWSASSTNFNKWFDKEKSTFDPGRVDWAELMTLYQDDPLLMAIFEGLKERFADGEDSFLGLPAQPSGSGGTYLSGITTSTGTTTTTSTVSPTFTLKYDTTGVAIVSTDASDVTNSTVTWKATDE